MAKKCCEERVKEDWDFYFNATKNGFLKYRKNGVNSLHLRHPQMSAKEMKKKIAAWKKIPKTTIKQRSKTAKAAQDLADSLMTPEQIESANAFMEMWRSYGTDKA